MTGENAKARLLELAARCEAASGPERELDRDIMLVAVPCDRAPFRYWAPMNENTGHGAVDVERVYYAPHCAQAVAVPKFSASLDAAMSLRPDGWTIAQLGESDTGGWWAELRRGHRTSYDATAFGKQLENASPALALTAACLRARALATQGEAE